MKKNKSNIILVSLAILDLVLIIVSSILLCTIKDNNYLIHLISIGILIPYSIVLIILFCKKYDKGAINERNMPIDERQRQIKGNLFEISFFILAGLEIGNALLCKAIDYSWASFYLMNLIVAAITGFIFIELCIIKGALELKPKLYFGLYILGIGIILSATSVGFLPFKTLFPVLEDYAGFFTEFVFGLLLTICGITYIFKFFKYKKEVNDEESEN